MVPGSGRWRFYSGALRSPGKGHRSNARLSFGRGSLPGESRHTGRREPCSPPGERSVAGAGSACLMGRWLNLDPAPYGGPEACVAAPEGRPRATTAAFPHGTPAFYATVSKGARDGCLLFAGVGRRDALSWWGRSPSLSFLLFLPNFISDDFRTSFFAHSQPSAEAASIYCIGGVCVFSMSVFLSSPTLPSVSLNRESSVLGVSLRCMCVVSSRLTFIVFADGVTCDTRA